MPILTPDKIVCYFCAYIHIDEGHPPYSEYTPGENFKMYCGNGKWMFSVYDDEKHLAKCLQTAKNCSFFKFIDYTKE
jgi:hypothetical protein